MDAVERDWAVRWEWFQATPADGLYEWRLAIDVEGTIELIEGHASTALGVRVKVWRALRSRGVKHAWRAFSKPKKASLGEVAGG